MKKFLLAILIILFMATGLMAASTQTVTYTRNGECVRTIKINWTAHTDGSYTSYAFTGADMAHIQGYMLHALITDPGSTAPQDNYDIYLKYNGADLLNGSGENRHTTTTQINFPLKFATYQKADIAIPGDLTFELSGNNVNAAIGLAEFVFVKHSCSR